METEQICEKDSVVSSFVVVRGSAPVRWAQPLRDVNWRFPVAFLDGDDDETSPGVESARLHFQHLANAYGSVVVLDLLKVNGNRSETRLGKRFKAAVEKIRGTPYSKAAPEGSEGSEGRLSITRLSIDLAGSISRLGDRKATAALLQITAEDAARVGAFVENSGAVVKRQAGTFRVNCKDCLDRTNLAQTALGVRAFAAQLRVGSNRDETDLEGTNAAEPNAAEPSRVVLPGAAPRALRLLWSRHGDDLSLAYAGSPALRGDVSRTGARTVLGVAADARVALARYARSKFSDGETQDAARFFLCAGDDAPLRRTSDAELSAPRACCLGVRGEFLNQPRYTEEDDAWAFAPPRGGGSAEGKRPSHPGAAPAAAAAAAASAKKNVSGGL